MDNRYNQPIQADIIYPDHINVKIQAVYTTGKETGDTEELCNEIIKKLYNNNSELELGVYFPSMRTLEINLFIQLSYLNYKWMRKPVATFRANLYEMRQILNVKFGLYKFRKKVDTYRKR